MGVTFHVKGATDAGEVAQFIKSRPGRFLGICRDGWKLRGRGVLVCRCGRRGRVSTSYVPVEEAKRSVLLNKGVLLELIEEYDPEREYVFFVLGQEFVAFGIAESS